MYGEGGCVESYNSQFLGGCELQGNEEKAETTMEKNRRQKMFRLTKMVKNLIGDYQDERSREQLAIKALVKRAWYRKV